MRQFFTLLPLALLTGIAAGLAALVFIWLIEVVLVLFYGSGDFAATISAMPAWQRVLIPTTGGFLVGLLVMVLKRTDIGGEGVPHLLEAVLKKRSRLQLVGAPLKILATAITLGSGGSAGKEGPIVQIGGTLGSTIGGWAKQSEVDRRLLIAAGAAAGIAGVFGAPIAGIVFSVELILKRVTFSRVVLLAVAVTAATLLTQFLGAPSLQFALPEAPATDWVTLVLSLPLGAIAGAAAVVFGFSLFLSTTLFNHYKLPAIIPGAIGGFLVGVISLVIPYIHEPMMHPLVVDLLGLTSLPLLLLLGIFIAKITATAITLGSGGSGGVFAPSLLIGTVLGALYIGTISMLGVTGTDSSITLILVGMAAFFAGVTHAPITAIVILVELTNEPLVLPAVALATFTGYLVAKLMHKESVYTEHLDRHGGYLEKFNLNK